MKILQAYEGTVRTEDKFNVDVVLDVVFGQGIFFFFSSMITVRALILKLFALLMEFMELSF